MLRWGMIVHGMHCLTKNPSAHPNLMWSSPPPEYHPSIIITPPLCEQARAATSKLATHIHIHTPMSGARPISFRCRPKMKMTPSIWRVENYLCNYGCHLACIVCMVAFVSYADQMPDVGQSIYDHTCNMHACMYYGRNAYMYCGRSKCMYYGHSTYSTCVLWP